MTYEELVASGFDEETARKLADNNVEASAGGLPFDVIKINYDKEDILIDAGVKKGEYIVGWKINKTTLAIEEKGKVFKKPLEFIVVAQGYQNSAYDPKTNGYKYITEVFTNPFDSRKVKEQKTGLTVGELKDQGEVIKFNDILLVLIKEEDSFKPYLIYIRGVNYAFWLKQLEEKGVDAKSIGLKYSFKVDTKKVPTNAGIPAWIIDVKGVKPLDIKDIISMKDVVAPVIKKFDDFVKSSKGISVDKKPSTTEVSEDEDVDTLF